VKTPGQGGKRKGLTKGPASTTFVPHGERTELVDDLGTDDLSEESKKGRGRAGGRSRTMRSSDAGNKGYKVEWSAHGFRALRKKHEVSRGKGFGQMRRGGERRGIVLPIKDVGRGRRKTKEKRRTVCETPYA